MFASLILVLFVLWLIKAEDFETGSNTDGSTVEYGYKDAIRDSFLWKYTIGFGGFLFLYVLALTALKPVFDEYTMLDGAMVNLLISGAGILGTFAGVRIGNKGTPRKPVLQLSGVMMIVFFARILVFAKVYPIVLYGCAFLSGFVMFVQYPIYMNLPHEFRGATPQKLTVLFGLFWAMGYAVETILKIVWSYLLGSAGYTVAMTFLISGSCLYPVLAGMLPETRPGVKNVSESKVA